MINLDYAFDININDFRIELSKRISKKEKILLRFILTEFKLNKSVSIALSLEKIKELRLEEDFFKTYEKLLEKKIFFSLYENNSLIFSLTTPIIESVTFYKEEYNFFLPSTIISALKKNSLFYKINILAFFFFEDKTSIEIYKLILKNLDSGSFSIQLEEFKKLLELSDNYYLRFYDFEKIILKPLLKDINEATDYMLNYEKIKKTDKITSKVQELLFTFKNIQTEHIQNNFEDIIFSIKNSVDFLGKTTQIIEKFISEKDIEYVKTNIQYVLENFQPPLDNEIFKSLNLNYAYHLQIKECVLFTEIKEIYKHLYIFESTIYKEMLKLKFYYNYTFLAKLHDMKNTNRLIFENENFKIEAFYCGKEKESTLKISKFTISQS
ncbi:MAG: hypothetical protein ACRC6K_06490 [Fusobacteriaceae bacterium]